MPMLNNHYPKQHNLAAFISTTVKLPFSQTSGQYQLLNEQLYTLTGASAHSQFLLPYRILYTGCIIMHNIHVCLTNLVAVLCNLKYYVLLLGGAAKKKPQSF
jgi:hypothetical protein